MQKQLLGSTPMAAFLYFAAMARVLIQFAHPLLEKSRIQKQMLRQAKLIKGITINDRSFTILIAPLKND